MRIGFAGLGNMGRGMVRNLLRAGHQVQVFNRTREKAAELVKEGATVADTPAAVARGVEVVLSMLADDAAAQEVTFGEQGLASGLPEGVTHISHSTISVACARQLWNEHTRRKQGFLSAPVFGRPEAAESKKLIVVAAGPDDAVQRFKPILDAIGRATYTAGAEPWQANAIKLSGNFMLVSMVESFGEAFAVLRKAGVDHHLFYDIMVDLFGSPVYKNYGGFIAKEQFSPAGFPLRLGMKDIRLALELAQEVAAPMPLASLIRDHYLSAMAHGQSELDWSSVSMVAARDAGLK